MIDALGGSSVKEPSWPRRVEGGPTVPARGHPAAHTDQSQPAPGIRPSTPDRHDAPVSGAASSRAGGGEGLSHLAYFYDDERDSLSYLSAFARVLDPGRLVQGMDVQAVNPPFALGEFGVGLAAAAHLAGHPVVLRAETLLELAAARHGQGTDDQGHHDNGHDDGYDRSG